MLKSIKLSNFRKHTNSAFNFEPGMSVMRGANEAGKSTLLEGVAYALFGVKALRSPLADTVTWGEAESTLKAVLELSVDGVDYVVSRGKSGAEVNYDGGRVTGQTEVTSFIASKLKVDASSAAKLMLSTQLDIRGALEAGPKATTELIERLAEFDQIDNLIEVMQEKLTLGNTSVAVAALDAAQAKVSQVVELVEPDLPALQRAITNAQASVDLAQAEFANAKSADRAAQAESLSVQATHREEVRLQTKLNVLRGKQRQVTADRQSHDLAEPPIVKDADERIQSALREKAALSEAATVRRVFAEVSPLLGKQAVEYYPGEMNDLIEELDETRDEVSRAKAASRKAALEIAQLEAKLLLNSCTFCGKDFSDVPEVQAKNAEVLAAIEKARLQVVNADADGESADDKVTKLDWFLKSARIVDGTVAKFAQYLDVDRRTVPSILTWKEDIVVIPASDVLPDYDGEIASIKAAVKARAEWERAVQASEDEASRLTGELAEVNVALAALPKVDLQASADAEQAARRAADDAQSTLDDMRATLSTAQNTLRNETQRWAREAQGAEDARANLETAQANLKNLEFNNALLKRVRTARPVIADRLWNLVLASVSSYFSEMRGTRSVVSKTSDGFLVDGKPVAVLSGSTLDILGLAIRVALVRTFLPAAPFLVLDEPAASMDMARTESMLGFLVAVGFKQVLLVTHEDVSESVADHIIAIGE